MTIEEHLIGVILFVMYANEAIVYSKYTGNTWINTSVVNPPPESTHACGERSPVMLYDRRCGSPLFP